MSFVTRLVTLVSEAVQRTGILKEGTAWREKELKYLSDQINSNFGSRNKDFALDCLEYLKRQPRNINNLDFYMVRERRGMVPGNAGRIRQMMTQWTKNIVTGKNIESGRHEGSK